MNTQLLAELAAQNRAALLFFAVFAGRRNAVKQPSVQSVIDLARRYGVTVSAAEVAEFYQGLEAANCGRFLPSSDPNAAHFVWIVSCIDAAQAVQKIQPLDLSQIAPPAAKPAISAASPVEMVAHTLRLRADLFVTLNLPADFSFREAERLKSFVAALPLSEDVIN